MIIGCPECATKFGIPDGALGDVGRKVRCAKCGNVWLATKDDAIEVDPTPTPVAIVESSEESSSPVDEQPEEPEVEPQVEANDVADDLNDDVDEQELADDMKGLGDSSVEEALAVIKGSSFEEPDFPLDKGQISEFEVIANSKTLMIGWGALGVFLISVLLVFFLMQDTLRHAWPPITKLYDVVGLIESQEKPAEEAVIDFSQYIRISNEAAVERLADGTPALVIRGAVTNSASFDIELPSVEVVLRNERRQDIYVWPFEFDEKVLKAGKTMPFIEAVRNTPQETSEFELMLLWDK